MRPYFTDDSTTLYHGDAATVLATLPDGSADCIVTSPPYLGLRDYGVAGQIGAESSPAEYVAALVAVFHEARRVLADDGTLWLNLGDSYDSAKNLLGIPWRVAFALQDDGWILRNDIIWHKSNAMPESVTDRLSNRHEHLFMLSKSQRYWFDLDPIREPHESTPDRAGGTALRGQKAIRPSGPNSGAYSEGGRNPGDVWPIASQPFKGVLRTSHRHPARHGQDEPVCDKGRIGSAGCPLHGSPDRLDSMTSRDERGAAPLPRTSDTDVHHGQEPAPGCVPIETSHEPSTLPSSSDSGCPCCSNVATPRSSETHRKDHAPETNQPYTPSARSAHGIESSEASPESAARGQSRHGNRNETDESHAASGRTVADSAHMCTCSCVHSTSATSHFATMPPALAERCVRAGCKPGGTVLDPFSGSGTTGLAAARHGRRYVGIDLNREYLDLSLRTRLAQPSLITEATA